MMNTAAGSVGLPPMLASQSVGVDELAQESMPDASFTAALAATIIPEVVDEIADIAGSEVPEGMQSAAALAWMAGLLSLEVPRRDVPLSSFDPPADIAPGTVAQPQMPATEELTADAAFAAQFIAQDVVDAAPVAGSALGALGPTIIKVAVARDNGEANTNQATEKPDSGVMMGVGDSDALMAQTRSDVTRLLNAFLDQSGARDLPAPRMDAPVPALYTNSREAYLSAATAEVVAHESLRQPVGSPRWAAELATRIMLMSVRGQQEGSLSLTPEHLGPLEIRINVSQDTTNVWFGAQHADTRAALTDAMPRLREMLAASGLALGHAGVSHQMPRHEARQAEASALAAGGSDESIDMPATNPTVRRIRAVLLDAWA